MPTAFDGELTLILGKQTNNFGNVIGVFGLDYACWCEAILNREVGGDELGVEVVLVGGGVGDFVELGFE